MDRSRNDQIVGNFWAMCQYLAFANLTGATIPWYTSVVETTRTCASLTDLSGGVCHTDRRLTDESGQSSDGSQAVLHSRDQSRVNQEAVNSDRDAAAVLHGSPTCMCAGAG